MHAVYEQTYDGRALSDVGIERSIEICTDMEQRRADVAASGFWLGCYDMFCLCRCGVYGQ